MITIFTDILLSTTLQSDQTFTHVSAYGQSVLHARALCSCKQNVFLLHISTRVTSRKTLLSDSDDQHFIVQTFFHCQYYIAFLCVFNL